MKSLKLCAVALSVVIVTGCASAPEANRALDRLKPATAETLQSQRELMVGRWYGEAETNEGQTRRWLRENYAEGTYKLTIRDYWKDGSFQQQVEAGQWGVSGPIYFTIMKGWQEGERFRSVNPANPYYYDAYQILTLTPQDWVYQHADTGLRFIVKRAAEDFTLPGEEPAPVAAEAKPKAAAKAKTSTKSKKKTKTTAAKK